VADADGVSGEWFIIIIVYYARRQHIKYSKQNTPKRTLHIKTYVKNGAKLYSQGHSNVAMADLKTY